MGTADDDGGRHEDFFAQHELRWLLVLIVASKLATQLSMTAARRQGKKPPRRVRVLQIGSPAKVPWGTSLRGGARGNLRILKYR
jgi:hypothetical protein